MSTRTFKRAAAVVSLAFLGLTGAAATTRADLITQTATLPLTPTDFSPLK